MVNRLPAVAALLCLSISGCAATIGGTAVRAAQAPLTTADALPSVLLPADDISAAMSANDIVVTRDVAKAWNDSAHFTDVNCLAIAGAAQQSVYADTGWTATHSQVLREPPTSPVWSHYAVQSVVLFPTAQAASDFYAASRDGWARCSNRQLTYAQQLGPDQMWSVGPTSTDHDILAVSRVERGTEPWACQRALTVHSNVAVDIEACSLDGPTAAASSIARQIAERLPAT